jgi:hypothetical protein
LHQTAIIPQHNTLLYSLSVNPKLSPKSVSLYISALSYFHKINHLPDPTKSFQITKALQGLKRNDIVFPDNRLPITLPILNQLVLSLHTVCSNTYDTKLFTCAFSLAYFGLLRVGEFTVINPDTLHSFHCIQIQHVQTHPNTPYFKLSISHSKTDQSGKSTTQIIHSQIHSPVSSLIHPRFLADYESYPSKPLFFFNSTGH